MAIYRQPFGEGFIQAQLSEKLTLRMGGCVPGL
jgi:hypothetical protein